MTFKQYMKRAWPLYVMIVPGVIFVLLFRYYPMYGVVIAFQDFSPARGFAGFTLDRLGEFRISVFPAGIQPDFRQHLDHLRSEDRRRSSRGDYPGAVAERGAPPCLPPHNSDHDLPAAFPLLDCAGRDSAGYPVGGRHSQPSHSCFGVRAAVVARQQRLVPWHGDHFGLLEERWLFDHRLSGGA